MDDVNKLKAERSRLFSDFFNNKLPERLPITMRMPHAYLAKRANAELIDVQYNFELIKDASREVCDLLCLDSNPVTPAGDTALYNQILGSKPWVMAANGFMQHPEVSGMEAEDYDYFIEDPYACIIERIIPRLYTNLDPKNPHTMMKTLTIARASEAKECSSFNAFLAGISAEKGYYPGAPRGSRGMALAPCDFLADQCRSFSAITTDMRRNPQKVKDACDAILPYIFKFGLPSNPHPEGAVSSPLHMPTFIREKDFVNIWLPSYKRLVEGYASVGARFNAFLEDDWTRYLDIIASEFPAGTMLRFEYGDAKLIKEKLGKKFILANMFPLDIIRTGNKQQVIDKAKELLDILMPGGGYQFGFTKTPIAAEDINMENLIALFDFMKEYAVYPNAGENYGTPLNSEGFKCDIQAESAINTKYKFDWDAFKKENPYAPDFVRADLERYNNDIMNFYLGLFN